MKGFFVLVVTFSFMEYRIIINDLGFAKCEKSEISNRCSVFLNQNKEYFYTLLVIDFNLNEKHLIVIK